MCVCACVCVGGGGGEGRGGGKVLAVQRVSSCGHGTKAVIQNHKSINE